MAHIHKGRSIPEIQEAKSFRLERGPKGNGGWPRSTINSECGHMGPCERGLYMLSGLKEKQVDWIEKFLRPTLVHISLVEL